MALTRRELGIGVATSLAAAVVLPLTGGLIKGLLGPGSGPGDLLKDLAVKVGVTSQIAVEKLQSGDPSIGISNVVSTFVANLVQNGFRPERDAFFDGISIAMITGTVDESSTSVLIRGGVGQRLSQRPLTALAMLATDLQDRGIDPIGIRQYVYPYDVDVTNPEGLLDASHPVLSFGTERGIPVVMRHVDTDRISVSYGAHFGPTWQSPPEVWNVPTI